MSRTSGLPVARLSPLAEGRELKLVDDLYRDVCALSPLAEGRELK